MYINMYLQKCNILKSLISVEINFTELPFAIDGSESRDRPNVLRFCGINFGDWHILRNSFLCIFQIATINSARKINSAKINEFSALKALIFHYFYLGCLFSPNSNTVTTNIPNKNLDLNEF